MHERDRMYKEGENLFADPKFARDAWKAVGHAILQNPATRLPSQYDKDGNETLASQIDSYCYSDLMKNIKEIQKEDRAPTELEMIMACQIRKARYDTQAAIFVRDTCGAKPVDESKLDARVTNEYEHLSDAELAMLAANRKAQQTTKENVKERVEEAKEESKGDQRW